MENQKRLAGNVVEAQMLLIFWSRERSPCCANRSVSLAQPWRLKLGFKWSFVGSLQGVNFTCCEQILWYHSALIISVALLNKKSLQAPFCIQKKKSALSLLGIQRTKICILHSFSLIGECHFCHPTLVHRVSRHTQFFLGSLTGSHLVTKATGVLHLQG